MDYIRIRLLPFVMFQRAGRLLRIESTAMHTEPRMHAEQALESSIQDNEELASQHPGLARFADEMRRNHPGISDAEIAELFEAWTR